MSPSVSTRQAVTAPARPKYPARIAPYSRSVCTMTPIVIEPTGFEDPSMHEKSFPTFSQRPHSRREAEVEDIVRALNRYGVLTRANLLDVCGASHWSDSGFGRALTQAVSSGRVKHLGDDLYEITERPIR